MQNVAAGMEKASVLLSRASSDLLHPRFVWMPGDASDGYASTFQMEKEEYIIRHQSSPAKDIHRKEITTRQHIHVSSEKILPRRNLASLGSWSNSVPAKYVFHGLIRQEMTQVGRRSHDAVVAPTGVFPRHPDH